jgi:hypothetical protein
MPGEPEQAPAISPESGVVAHFQVGPLLDSSGDVRVYRGRDELVEREVLLRVAGSALLTRIRRVRRDSLIGAPLWEDR